MSASNIDSADRSSKDLLHEDSFRPNFQSIVEYDDDDDDESELSRDNFSLQSDSISCSESVSSDILQQHYLPTVQARKLRLSKAVKKSNYGKTEPMNTNIVDSGKLYTASSAKSFGSVKDAVNSSSNYVYGGGKKKDYTSYFMGLDNASLEEMQNHNSADKIDDVTKKLQLTKCVTYLSPDAISWMNKRRPHAINDKTLHYSHITPSKALQLLAIFRGLDHDNSGQISKKELQDALRYVTSSQQKNDLTQESLSRKTSTFGQSSTNPSRRGSVSSQALPSIQSSKKRDSDLSIQARKSSMINSISSKQKPLLNPLSILPKEISKDSLSHLFDSMDIDGDGMVDFNEFVVQLTSSKGPGEVDNERMEQAFFEFATAHQRQKIIDSLHDKDNKLNDVQKYYQLRKLFKMELLQGDSDGRSHSERSKAKLMSEMNQKRNHQHILEKQRARLALSSIRVEKKLKSIGARDILSCEPKQSLYGTKAISKKLKAVEEFDRELDDFIHGSTVAPTNHLEASLYQAFSNCVTETPYQKSKQIADGVLKRMSDFPLPRININEVNKSGNFKSKMRMRVLDDVSNVKEMTMTYGHQLPPLPSLK